MFGFIARTLAIVLTSTALGGAVAAWRGFSWTPDQGRIDQLREIKTLVQESRASIRAAAAVTYDEFRDLVAQGAVVMDARPRSEFEKGHLKIEGSIPVLNIEAADLVRHIERLEGLQGMPWVLYCTSDTCEFAEDLYVALNQMGLLDKELVKIYFPGWEDFLARKLPTAIGPDEWRPAGSGDLPPEESQYRLMLQSAEPTYRPTESAPAAATGKEPE